MYIDISMPEAKSGIYSLINLILLLSYIAGVISYMLLEWEYIECAESLEKSFVSFTNAG